MPEKDTFDEALARFETHESIQQRIEEGALNTDLFTIALHNSEEELLHVCGQPDVKTGLAQEFETHQKSVAELELLRSTGLVSEETLQEREAQLEADKSRPVYRLAEWFLGSRTVADSVRVQQNSEVATPAERAKELLSGSAATVAKKLIGKKLTANGVTVTITETLAQDKEANQKWSNDPMFSEGRSQIEVAQSYGNNILYFAVGDVDDLECVRIVAAETIDGKKLKKASHVTQELGFTDDLRGGKFITGTLHCDGEGRLKIVRPQQISTK